jgi:plasmid maintenance system killer protein
VTKEWLEDQKKEIFENRTKIDQIKVDIIDEATTLRELDYLNRIEYEKLELKYGELTKKVRAV